MILCYGITINVGYILCEFRHRSSGNIWNYLVFWNASNQNFVCRPGLALTSKMKMTKKVKVIIDQESQGFQHSLDVDLLLVTHTYHKIIPDVIIT